MDDDTLSNLQSPTLQKWSSFLQDTPTQCDEDMSIAYPNLIAYVTDLLIAFIQMIAFMLLIDRYPRENKVVCLLTWLA
jgi:hypothetical protein